MNQHYRYILFLIVVAMLPHLCFAQQPTTTDTLQQKPFNYNINLETGIYSGLGHTHAYTQIAPTFEYQITPKLKTFGGFSFVNDVNTSALYHLRNYNDRSYAPLRNSSQAAAIKAGLVYKPNSHLTLAASAFYIGGHHDPLWNFSGEPLPLKAYGFSAEMNYKFNDNNSIYIYFDFIRDQTGTFLSPYLYDYLNYGGYPLHSWGNPYHNSPIINSPLFNNFF